MARAIAQLVVHGWHAVGPEFNVHNCNKPCIRTIPCSQMLTALILRKMQINNHCGITSHQGGCLKAMLKLIKHPVVAQMICSGSAAQALLLQGTVICAHGTPLGSAGHTLSDPIEHPPAPLCSIFMSCQRFLQLKTKALLTTKEVTEQLALRKAVITQQRKSFGLLGSQRSRRTQQVFGRTRGGNDGAKVWSLAVHKKWVTMEGPVGCPLDTVATKLPAWLERLTDSLCNLI